MFSPQIPVTTCSRQVRGMSCSPSRRWDSGDFCGRGKKQNHPVTEARSLLSSSTTGVTKPSSALQEGSHLLTGRTKPPTGLQPSRTGFGHPRIKHVTLQHKQWLHHLFRRVLLRDERHLKVGAYQLSPKVILAVLSTHALLHKVHLVNDDLA